MQAYQCKSFTTVRYLTAAKRPGCLQAALMLLPFRSTDPEQRVNSQSRLPRSQADRASALDAPGFHWFTNPRKARDYERVTGT